MNKKNLLIQSLLLLPLCSQSSLLGMEQKEISSLEQSMIVIPMPTTRGLGLFHALKEVAYGEEETTYNALVTKEFTPANSSWPRKLDTAIEAFASNNNNPRLISIFDMCIQHYPKQIKINDTAAIMAHQSLVRDNKKKQAELKTKIETKDQQYLKEHNILIEQLKVSMATQIKIIQKTLAAHLKSRETIVQEDCNEIIKTKRALIILHQKLNKQFILPKNTENADDGYCSDEERNPDNVKNSYNSQHILSKINVSESMFNTEAKSNQSLNELKEINDTLIRLLSEIRYQ